MEAIEENKVGILLAQGYTKKEVASKLNKSFHTVNQQTRCLYEKTGCRNLADLTRYIVTRYSGIHVNDLLIRAMQDITIGVAVGLFTWLITRPGALAEIAAGLQNWFK